MRVTLATFASVVPRTPNQEKYAKALRSSIKPIVIATGPAGTGKTLLACNEAMKHLASGKTNKLVITRPTKSVDEEHGFLPGGINQKLAPWVQPIYDSFKKAGMYNRIEGKLEIAPLAYMRGRTFDNSWIIADEMQNATSSQTKMLLTRIGENSKLVITGDLEQIDIRESGLFDLMQRITNYDHDLQHIKCIAFGTDDVLRHYAIKEILTLYD